MKLFLPVILAGGAGKRLFPISSYELPKQFIKSKTKKYSYFQKTILRAKKLNSLDKIIISTHVHYKKIISKQITDLKFDLNEFLIIYENESKNTAFAFLCSSIITKILYGSQKIIFLPSDHIINNIEYFNKQINIISNQIALKKIYLLAIKNKILNSNFGYISINNKTQPYNIEKFIEKPSREKLNELKHNNNLLCNSGIYLAYNLAFINEFTLIDSNYVKKVREIIKSAIITDNEVYIDIKAELDSISFDKKISEKSQNLAAWSFIMDWLDIGNFNGFWSDNNVNGQIELDLDIAEEKLKLFLDNKKNFTYELDQQSTIVIKRTANFINDKSH